MSTPTLPSVPPLARLAKLESRYDGPIPAWSLTALRHGSPLAVALAETRAELAFFRAMAARARRAGKSSRARGDAANAARAVADGRLYLSEWRRRRTRLKSLEGTGRVEVARLRTLSAIGGLLAPLAAGRSAGDRR